MWNHWFLCHGTNVWYLVHRLGLNQLSNNVALLLLDTCQILFFKLQSAGCTNCYMSLSYFAFVCLFLSAFVSCQDGV